MQYAIPCCDRLWQYLIKRNTQEIREFVFLRMITKMTPFLKNSSKDLFEFDVSKLYNWFKNTETKIYKTITADSPFFFRRLD